MLHVFLTEEEWRVIESLQTSMHIDYLVSKGRRSYGTARGHRYSLDNVVSALLTASLSTHQEEIDEDLKSRRILAVTEQLVAFTAPDVTEDPGESPKRRRARRCA